MLSCHSVGDAAHHFFVIIDQSESSSRAYAIFGAATFLLISPHLPCPLPLLRASSGCPSNGPPMGDRDQIIMDHGIQKLKDMISFFFPLSPHHTSPPLSVSYCEHRK